MNTRVNEEQKIKELPHVKIKEQLNAHFFSLVPDITGKNAQLDYSQEV